MKNDYLNDLIVLANKLDRKGMAKQADAIDSFIKEAQLLPVIWQWLTGCAQSENDLTLLDVPEARPGSDELEPSFSTGQESIEWEELPDCTNKVQWEPSVLDSRWDDQGIPLGEFFMVGRSESLPAKQYMNPGEVVAGTTMFMSMATNGKTLWCTWQNVPDSCSYWGSEYSSWSNEQAIEDRDEIIEGYYERFPLLDVTVGFDVTEEDGEKYVDLPNYSSGATVQGSPLNTPCVREYLEAIGMAIEDYEQ